MKIISNLITCPVCGNICSVTPFRYTTEQSATHICPPTRDFDRNQRLIDVLDRLWPEGICEINRCNNCGFGFGVPFIGGSEEYYKILHEQMGYPKWRWDYDVALHELNNLSKGKVLDIGAGIGRFLLALNSNWELYAIESSSSTITILEKKGISTFQSLEHLIENFEGQFSCITLFQVLEHISTFDNILKQSNKLLAKNGKIIITVPDADAMFLQERILGHADMPPHHINKWTKKSLTIALEKNGFEVKYHTEEKKSIKNILAKVHLKILHNSGKKGSLTSKIYKIRNKKIRVILVSLIAPFTFFSLIAHLAYLMKGGAFATVAVKKQ